MISGSGHKEIIESLAAQHGLTVETIIGRSMNMRVCAVRDEICYMLRHTPTPSGRQRSFPEIGRIMERHHASVMAAIDRHAEANGLTDLPTLYSASSIAALSDHAFEALQRAVAAAAEHRLKSRALARCEEIQGEAA